MLIQVTTARERIHVMLDGQGADASQRVAQALAADAGKLRAGPLEWGVQVQVGEQQQLHTGRLHEADRPQTRRQVRRWRAPKAWLWRPKGPILRGADAAPTTPA